MPYDKNFEVTLFTTAFQGTGYLFMMLFANVFYNLGYLVDRNFIKSNTDKFRNGLFNVGFWFSFALPFVIPGLTVMTYFIKFRK